jgi:hypothetical protein
VPTSDSSKRILYFAAGFLNFSIHAVYRVDELANRREFSNLDFSAANADE